MPKVALYSLTDMQTIEKLQLVFYHYYYYFFCMVHLFQLLFLKSLRTLVVVFVKCSKLFLIG